MPKSKQPKLKFGDYYTAEISFFRNNFPHITIVRVLDAKIPLFDLLTYEKSYDAINPKDLYYFKLRDKIDMKYRGPEKSELNKMFNK